MMETADLLSDPQYEPEFDDPETGRSYRTIGLLALLGVGGIGTLLFLFSSASGGNVVTRAMVDAEQARASLAGTRKGVYSGIPPSPMVLSHPKILDTVYTTDSLYLDVNLTRQNVTVRYRNGNERSFLISSGNRFLREGMSTPTGVFTVQNMTPMAISKQFNNAKLHHWIGVQGGVGFHGLDGSGYYGNLGVRPSSHGCIRMSREEIGDMYRLVHPGALIMVHYGNPARVIAFCDRADTAGATVIDSAAVYNRNLGKERLLALYDGKYWVEPQPRLVHLAKQRFRWGMEIGEAKRIPKQDLPQGASFAALKPSRPAFPSDRVIVSSTELQQGIASIRFDSLEASSRKHATAGAQPAEEQVEYGE
jgi:hypothetical protein